MKELNRKLFCVMNLKICIHISVINLLYLMELEMNKFNNYRIAYKNNNSCNPLYNNNNGYKNELYYYYILIYNV